MSIWQDKWINPSRPYKLISPRQILPDIAKVSDLIDIETHQWKKPLIDSIFWLEKVAQIKAILLSPSRQDSLVWIGTYNGIFTTQSAYHMLAKDKTKLTGLSSNLGRLHAFWKNLWSIDVPNKIQVFMWRACSSILPTKTNLFKQGIVSSSTCPNCNDEAETILHSLWECAYAKECWLNSPLSHMCSSAHPSNWSDLVGQVLSQGSTPETEISFVLAWKIWGCRNDAWLHKSQLATTMVGAKAVSYVEEFLEANQRVESARPTLEKKWFPPPSLCVKLNIAWKRFPARKFVGVGSVICDSAGVLMVTHCEALQHNGDSLHMAASAVVKVLTICKDAGFVDVLVEFSHPLLKALITSKEECLTELHDSINCI